MDKPLKLFRIVGGDKWVDSTAVVHHTGLIPPPGYRFVEQKPTANGPREIEMWERVDD